MSTPAQLAQYCLDHGFVFKTQLSQGKHMTSYLVPGTLTFDALIAVGAYMVGRVGLPVAWADIKGVYSWIRSKFSSTPVVTVVSA